MGRFKVYAETNEKENLIYIGETKTKKISITTDEEIEKEVSGYSPSINFTEETNVDEVERLLSNKREIVLYFLPIDRESLAIEKALVSLDNYLPKGVFMFSQSGKRKLHYAGIEEMKKILPSK